MNPRWQHILAASPPVGAPVDYNPLVKIADLDMARGKETSFGLNRSGNAKGVLSLYDPIIKDIFIGYPVRSTIRRCIIAIQDDQPVWSGPIFTTDGDTDSASINYNAVGWFELLNYRELSKDLIFNGINEDTDLPWTDADIAYALLDDANNQDPNFPTPITKGVASGIRQNRERKYTRGQKIGPLIHELSEVENGYDYEIDPLTLKLNIHGADSGKGVYKPDIHFGYNFGPSNLAKCGFAEDGSSVKNRIYAYGNQGVQPGLAQDLDSIGAFGVFQETATLTNVSDADILLAYAGAEVSVLSYPKLTFNITPFPYHPDLSVPRFKREYDIGDSGLFSMRLGELSIYEQLVRFYGATIAVNNDGVEIVSSLDIAPA